jgi:hypothetical protein
MLFAAKSGCNAVTGLDIVTLAIAVVGAVTGIGSLAWNIASHKLTGPRVRVELVGGWGGPSGVSPVPWESFNPADGPPSSELTEPIVGVVARNTGRYPASITSWTIQFGAVRYGPFDRPGNKPLPYRLGGGEENSWFLDFGILDAVVMALSNIDMSIAHLVAKVSLGTGETIESEHELVLPVTIVDSYEPPDS